MNSFVTASTALPALQSKILQLRVFFVGLAIDFWKDGSCLRGAVFLKRRQEPLQVKKPSVEPSSTGGEVASAENAFADSCGSIEAQVWGADAVQVMEKMWGEGFHLPTSPSYFSHLVQPLDLNRDMSILDISAGLGGLARKLVDDLGVYVTGMEPDQTLAARGMVMSIAAGKSKQASVISYDPAAFVPTRKYDCVIAREIFYRIVGKDRFFKSINDTVKSGGGKILFTDYVLEAESREQPAVVRWLKRERNAVPLAADEIIKTWKGLNYDVRIVEDQTEQYKTEILKGLQSFVAFLTANHPNQWTKALVVREVDAWSRRVAAMSQGLKYYRFMAVKN